MKTQLTLLLLLAFNVTLCAQTRPRARSAAQKPVPPKSAEPTAERVAARTRTKLDSTQKVQALAKEMARQMFTDDSLQKTKQLATQQAEAKRASTQNVSVTSRPATGKPQRLPRQNAVAPGISLGFRGSLLLSQLDVLSNGKNELGESSYRMALGGALLVSIPFGKRPFSIQLEPGYAERGGVFTAKGLMNNGTDRYEDKTTVKFQWLEMPVLFRFMPSVGPLNVVLTAGAEGRYLLSGKSIYTSAEYNVRTGAQVYAETAVSSVELDETNRLDVGLIGGLGISLPLSSGQIFLDGRYHHGLMDLVKDSKEQGYQHGFSANLGVLFLLH